jgi:hypothetical protein
MWERGKHGGYRFTMIFDPILRPEIWQARRLLSNPNPRVSIRPLAPFPEPQFGRLQERSKGSFRWRILNPVAHRF